MDPRRAFAALRARIGGARGGSDPTDEGGSAGEPGRTSRPKSAWAEAVDGVQAALRPPLKQLGFRVRGRTFNRVTEDGLTQVVSLQMGASDPPGTTYIPGLRENLHGLFTINLGVYVSEVAEQYPGSKAGVWVQDYHCCIRARLGEVSGTDTDLWWKADADEAIVRDVLERLRRGGLPFLDGFATRARILERLEGRTPGSAAPRIVRAIILATRGDRETARQQLALQIEEAADHPGHREFVRGLAARLGLAEVG